MRSVHNIDPAAAKAADHAPRETQSPTTEHAAVKLADNPGSRPIGFNGQPVRAIVWQTIGHSSTDDSLRRIRGDLVREGYDWYCRQFIDPIERFLGKHDAICWHNPFGVPAAGDMQFDQAMRANEIPVLRGLPPSFKKAIQLRTSGREHIAYLGNLGTGPISREGDVTQYFRLVFESLFHVLGAKCSVAIDVLHHLPPSDSACLVAELLRSRGVKVYAEPFPHASDAHLAPYPAIVMEDYYQRHYANGEPDWSYPLRFGNNAGERIRTFNQYRFGQESPDETRRRIVEFIRDCWSRGFSAGIPGNLLAETQQHIDDLVASAP